MTDSPITIPNTPTKALRIAPTTLPVVTLFLPVVTLFLLGTAVAPIRNTCTVMAVSFKSAQNFDFPEATRLTPTQLLGP